MAKCDACGREMLTAKGCSFSHIQLGNGKLVEREKVGDEGLYEEGDRCGDCGALFGHYHHPGCDIEQCPVCRLQLITCDCGEDEGVRFVRVTKKRKT